jgi:O-antigen/teichoic acid export membrane protein
LTGLPVIFCGFQLLRVWVGPEYALHTIRYLQILVFANIVRNLCVPYATMVSATGRQGAATAAAVSEALVNLSSSIYLASRFGAVGVALGTVLGSFVSVALHFAISMRLTHETLAASRSRLLFEGMLQPAIIAVPSLALFLFAGWHVPMLFNLLPLFLWGIATLLLAWFAGLTASERNALLRHNPVRAL